jgi:hypothetical protein
MEHDAMEQLGIVIILALYGLAIVGAALIWLHAATSPAGTMAARARGAARYMVAVILLGALAFFFVHIGMFLAQG